MFSFNLTPDESEEAELKLDDEVEFEVSAVGGKNRPRWDLNVDTGGTGIWAKGHVIAITPQYIEIKYEIEGYIGSGICRFPNYASTDYEPGQWDHDGYLRLISDYSSKNKLTCECGSDKLGLPSHSEWCQKFFKIY